MCDERERLIGFVYDECDADERREIARHLETCGTCRTEIGGLRAVRQDLLAWDVPEGPSVWRPFVAPIVVPWWKQVPAWAMATAASVMFLIGAAGGLVTHALTEQGGAAPAQAANRPGAVEPANLTSIIETLRAELAAQAAAPVTGDREATRTAARVDPDQLMHRVRALVGASEERQQDLIIGLTQDFGTLTTVRDTQIGEVKRELQRINEILERQGGR